MEKYLKKYSKLQNSYRLSVLFIAVSFFLVFLFLVSVLIPLLGISGDESSAVSSSLEFDRILLINNVLTVLIIVSSALSLIFALHGKKRSKNRGRSKKKSKK